MGGPRGGVEPGELPLGALRRELHEETGLVIDADPPHVWHQEVVAPDLADGYDGLVNDYFLIRTTPFSPRGVLSDDDLAAEHISGMQWWQHADIAAYDGTDLFSPRDLATPLASLIAGDIPDTPVIRPDQLEIIRRELAERVVERFVFESATAAVQAISCDHAATTTARRLARDGVRTRGG